MSIKKFTRTLKRFLGLYPEIDVVVWDTVNKTEMEIVEIVEVLDGVLRLEVWVK